jgi:hypothetical protein
MTGQTVGRAWVENQQGDNRVMGGEGLPDAYVYQLRVPETFSDDNLQVTNLITMIWRTYFKNFGTPSREKYIQAVHFDLNQYSGTALVSLVDLDGTLAALLPIVAVT